MLLGYLEPARAILVQEKSHSVVGINFNLLAHVKSMFNAKVE